MGAASDIFKMTLFLFLPRGAGSSVDNDGGGEGGFGITSSACVSISGSGEDPAWVIGLDSRGACGIADAFARMTPALESEAS